MRLLEVLSLPLEPSELASAVDAINAHKVRLITGLALADLQDRLAIEPPRRPVLGLDFATASTIDQGISVALDAAGKATASLWPALWGEDWSDARDDALGRAHRPLRLATLARRRPDLSPAWAEAAIGRLLRGASPRLPGVASEIEWAQLTMAISPDGLTLAVPLDSGSKVAERIQCLEWLARHGRVSVLVLTRAWPQDAAFERVLHGARRFQMRTAAPDVRSNESIASDFDHQVPPALALPSAPEGKPHPMSPTELSLHRLIQADEELRPLFAFNKTVAGLALLMAKVDLLWQEGRVAVEIDGGEHRGAAKFRADRHRDYELMCAGYRVLRMTNEDVATDAALAIEKIRRVVRIAKGDAA